MLFRSAKAVGQKMRLHPANQLRYLTMALFYLAALSIVNNVNLFSFDAFLLTTLDGLASGTKFAALHDEIQKQLKLFTPKLDLQNNPVDQSLAAHFANYHAKYTKCYSEVNEAFVDVLAAHGTSQKHKYLNTPQSLLCTFTDKTLFS